MPRMPMIGRPRAIQTTMCMTVMMKPIFHHSPWPMKPVPKKKIKDGGKKEKYSDEHLIVKSNINERLKIFDKKNSS